MEAFNRFNPNLKREDLVALEFTPSVSNIGKFGIMNVKEEDYITYVNNMSEQITAIIEDIQNKGNNNLNLVDILNLEHIDADIINPDFELLLQYASTLIANVQTFRSLGVPYADFTFQDVSLESYKISKVNLKVVEKLVDAILSMEDGNIANELGDAIFDACYDYVSQRLSPYLFLTENKLITEIDTMDKSPDDLIVPYQDAYNDWVIEETGKVLAKIARDPSNACIIHPVGFDACKEKIKSILPEALHSYIDEKDYYDITSPDVLKTCMSHFKNTDTQRQIAIKIVSFLEELVEINKGAELELGGAVGDKTPTKIAHAVSIADIVLLAIIKASDSLFLLYDPLPENTYTIKSLYDEAMVDLGLNINEVTPWRIMSTVAKALPVTTAKSLLLRLTDQNYTKASQSVGTILIELITARNKDKMQEEESENNGN